MFRVYDPIPMIMLLAALPLLAQVSESSSIDLYSPLISTGVAGVVIIFSLVGLIWWKPAVNIILDQLVAVTAQRDALINQISTEILPVLKEVNERVIPVLARQAEKDEKLDRAAEQLKAAGQAMDRMAASNAALVDEIRRQSNAR